MNNNKIIYHTDENNQSLQRSRILKKTEDVSCLTKRMKMNSHVSLISEIMGSPSITVFHTIQGVSCFIFSTIGS